MSLNWQNLLKIAYSKAQESANPSTQNGAILVDGEGNVVLSAANTFPDGIAETKERNTRPLRHKFSVHAERNALYHAARSGIKTKGLIMVCPWAACSDCAQAIIQTGITLLVTHKEALERSKGWHDDIQLALTMLREAGIEVIMFEGKIGACKILRSGEFWEP